MATRSTPPRTLSIGGATHDLFGRTLEPLTVIQVGAKIRLAQALERTGGGAANSSVGLARLGCQACFAGVVGDDHWGEELLRALQREGVNTDATLQVDGEMTSFSMIVNVQGGDRIILYTPGTNTHLSDATFDRTAMERTDWIYLTSLQESSMNIEDDIVSALADRETAGLTWNPGGSHILRGMQDAQIAALLRQTDILQMNREESLQFTGRSDVTAALRVLHDAGAHWVIITDGREGAMATDGISVFHCPTMPHVEVVDTTGAGDAFGVGVTWARLQGGDLPNGLRAGTVNATSVVAAIGAQPGLLTDTEMRDRLNRLTLPVQVVCPLA